GPAQATPHSAAGVGGGSAHGAHGGGPGQRRRRLRGRVGGPGPRRTRPHRGTTPPPRRHGRGCDTGRAGTGTGGRLSGAQGGGAAVKRRKPRTGKVRGFPKNCSAASYSPTGSPLQYH